jgi:nitroimidazol reductase NimA-like FMN-containing flavoprotein (pyridoxamine 5'-phosphate oxidase superfamily)
LLGSATVGRLAVAVANVPDIFPLNFIVDRETVVFRTGEGSKLAALAIESRVAFEADGYDEGLGEAWSVVVKGRAEEIKQLYDVVEASTFPIFPWQAGSKHRVVRIAVDEISGRRFAVLQPGPQRS